MTDEYIKNILKRDPEEYRAELARQKEEMKTQREAMRLQHAEDAVKQSHSDEAAKLRAREKLAAFSEHATSENARIIDLHEMPTIQTSGHERKRQWWKKMLGLK